MTSAQEKILAKRISMINNINASPDVTFLVGSSKTEIKAHKMFLITASEVFEAMFSEKFETEGEAKIVVDDIEEGPFLQVLHYCYTLKVSITENNMLGTLYAAEKYMLPELMEECTSYVFDRTNETNWSEIFNATHLLSCAQVNEKCFKIFQEDPMKFFEDPSFPDLCWSALKILVGLPKMNCTGDDLKRAVCSWFVDNDVCNSQDDFDENLLLKHGLRTGDFLGKQLQSMTREGDYLIVTKNFQINTTKIQILKERWLSGVGLCMGVASSIKDEMVKLTISQNDVVIHTVEREVKQSENAFFMDIMFRKKIVHPGTLYIKVEFEAEGSRYVSTNAICKQQQHFYSNSSYYHDSNSHNRCNKMIAGDPASPFSCIAHLIYAPS